MRAMHLRMTSLIVATLCSVAWLAPHPAQAAATNRLLSAMHQPAPPPAPAKAPAKPNASPTANSNPSQSTPPRAQDQSSAMPPSPCSAWAQDPAVLKLAPRVCRDYIASKGNNALVLEEPMVSKVPQEPEIIAEFAGIKGDTATAEFTVDQPWQVQIDSDSDFLMGEFRYGPMSREKVIRLPKFTASGSKKKTFKRPGTYYLNVRADGSWRAKVTLIEHGYQFDYDIAARSELVNPAPVPLLITFSFGESQRQEITLNPGQRLPISGNIALYDYTEPRSAEQLRADFPGLLIHKVENVSRAAAERREALIKKKRQANLDPKRTRSAARSELQHTAIGVQARNAQERKQTEKYLIQQSEAKDKRWKRGWGTAGVVTLLAGVGAGTALMVMGGTRLPEAKEGLARAKEKRAQMGDNPSPTIEVEIGRRSKEVSQAQNQLTAGIIIAAVGVAAGTGLLVVASRTPSKRRASRGYAVSVTPWLSPGLLGAGAGLRF